MILDGSLLWCSFYKPLALGEWGCGKWLQQRELGKLAKVVNFPDTSSRTTQAGCMLTFFLHGGWGRECQQHRHTQVLRGTMEEPRRRTRDKHCWASYMPRYAGRHDYQLATSAMESGIGRKIGSLSLNPYAKVWHLSLSNSLPPASRGLFSVTIA